MPGGIPIVHKTSRDLKGHLLGTMTVLPDHDHLAVGIDRNDIDPVVRFDDVKVVFLMGSRRQDNIRPHREDAVGPVGSGSNFRPGLDHSKAPQNTLFRMYSMRDDSDLSNRAVEIFAIYLKMFMIG